MNASTHLVAAAALAAVALLSFALPASAQDGTKTKPAAHGSMVEVPAGTKAASKLDVKSLDKPTASLVKVLEREERTVADDLMSLKAEQRHCAMVYSAAREYHREANKKSRDRLEAKVRGFMGVRVDKDATGSPMGRVVASVEKNLDTLDVDAAAVKAFRDESDRLRVALSAASEERKSLVRISTALSLLLRSVEDAKAQKRYTEAVDMYIAVRKNNDG